MCVYVCVWGGGGGYIRSHPFKNLVTVINIDITADLYNREVIIAIKETIKIFRVRISTRGYKRIGRGRSQDKSNITSSKIELNRCRNGENGGKHINKLNNGPYNIDIK